MPMIPAFCNNCGAVFSSGIFVENVSNLTMSNNTVGPCPRCGGMGRTEDGIFKVVNGVISKLKEINYSKDELASLIELLKKYQSKEEFGDLEISEESKSFYAPILELLPQDRKEKKAAFGFLITTLLTIISIFFSQSSETTINYDININYNQVINQTINEKPLTERVVIKTNKFARGIKNPAIKKEKIGRNELCPCDSGKKYKKCHGW